MYTLKDLETLINDIKMHDKDKFMLLNLLSSVKDTYDDTRDKK